MDSFNQSSTPQSATDDSTNLQPNIPQDNLGPVNSAPVDPYQSPQAVDNVAPVYDAPIVKNRKKSPLLMIVGVLLFLFLVLGGFGLVGVLAAYDKISLPSNFDNLDLKVTEMVTNLPFMPKTPKMVLMKSAMAHKDFKSAYFEFSGALESAELKEILKKDTVEFLIKGPMVVEGAEDVKTSMNINLANEFIMDAILIGNEAYFKLTKLPQVLADMAKTEMGADLSKAPIYNKWVKNALEESQLDTEASKAINESKDTNSDLSSQIEENLLKYLDDKILPILVMKEEKSEEGEDVYKLTLSISGPQVEEFTKIMMEEEGSSVSEMNAGDIVTVDQMDLVMTVAKKDFLVRKSSVVMTFRTKIPEGYTQVLGRNTNIMNDVQESEGQTSRMSMAVSLSKYGESFDISAPADAVDVEKFMMDLGTYFQSQSNLMYPPMEYETEDDFGGFNEDSGFETDDGGDSMLLPKGFDTTDRQRDSQRKNDILSIEHAIRIYQIYNVGKNNLVPTDGKTYQIGTCNFGGDILCEGAQPNCVDLSVLKTKGYIANIPLDPLLSDPQFTGYSVYMDSTGSPAVTSCLAEK